MGYARIDNLLELALGMLLVVQNLSRQVDDLNHAFQLSIDLELLVLDLHVLPLSASVCFHTELVHPRLEHLLVDLAQLHQTSKLVVKSCVSLDLVLEVSVEFVTLHLEERLIQQSLLELEMAGLDLVVGDLDLQEHCPEEVFDSVEQGFRLIVGV